MGLVCAAGNARAVDSYWTNVLGGDFAEDGNWDPNAVPGATTNVFFTNAATYEVNFTTDATNSNMNVERSTMTANLHDFNWHLTGELRIGHNGAVAGSLIATNGLLSVLGNEYVGGSPAGQGVGKLTLWSATNQIMTGHFRAGRTQIGATFDTGTVALAQGSLLQTVAGSIYIGDTGYGNIVASNSTIRAGAHEFIGNDSGRGFLALVASTNIVTDAFWLGQAGIFRPSGTVVLNDGSYLQQTGANEIHIGGSGDGYLVASNSAISFNTITYLGYTAGGYGEMRLDNSIYTGNATLSVGRSSSTGLVVLTSGSLLQITNTSGSNISLGGDGTALGRLVASNSTVTLAGGVQYGSSSRGELTLVNSTNSIGREIFVGVNVSTATGIVTVVENSVLQQTGAFSFRLGHAGYGEMNISNSVVTTPGTIEVGTGGTSTGVGVINNVGGTVRAGTITVGGTGNGKVIATDGGTLEANTLISGSAGSGIISNNGGVYQFTITSPTVTTNTAGTITLNNGTISYRDVTAANIFNAQVSNITFAGQNTFRLNHATNASIASYTFDNTGDPRNYQRLALTNGARWQSTTLTIGSGGALVGSGTVASDNVTNLGTIAPGFSSGSLTFTSNLVLGATSHLQMEIGGTASSAYDQLIVLGAVTVTGTLSVTPINAFSPTLGDTFTLIDNLGTNLISGQFDGLTNHAFLDASANGLDAYFIIQYDGGTGNDLVLIATIPEPSALLMIAVAAGLLLRRKLNRP